MKIKKRILSDKTKNKLIKKDMKRSELSVDWDLKPIDEDGYPIKRERKCFQCGKEFVLTFSFAQQNYSRNHFWDYWTEKKDDEGKYIDKLCLKNSYLDLENRKYFLETIDPNKHSHLRSYISRNIL